ncbi:hypothetical protein [Galbibacter sp.]|uniref:hypothetical protein n=1 Tax=Galbibacter sp. TaxID=2918471 RepID=UPI003A8D6066
MLSFEFLLKKTIIFAVFLTAIIATITYKKYKDSQSWIFMPFLWFTFLIELLNLLPTATLFYPQWNFLKLMRYLLPENLITSSIWVGSLYSIISFYVYLWYYRSILRYRKAAKAVNACIVIYSILVIHSLLHYQDLLTSWLQPHMFAGVVFTVVAICFYFMTILKSDKILSFYKTLPFWITIGILFFNLVTMPIFIFAKQLSFSASIYVYILVISNYVMYGCFAIGFIVSVKYYEPEENYNIYGVK